MIGAVLAIIRRDLTLSWRGLSDVIAGLSFFTMIIALVPLALGPDPASLALIAPAVLWIAALLATVPQMERLFAVDAAEGGIDHLLMTPHPLPLLVLGKAIAAWISIGLPLVLASPLMGMMLGLPTTAITTVMLALALGTLGLLLLGIAAAALVLGAKRGGVLMAILILPLAMPILIFGTAASAAAMTGDNAATALTLLAAITLMMLALAPPAAAISLRHAAE
ncbi:MAG: heme exporter protein CcmB [Alphaproteobacteria bacterium]|nr:heme exporter protein CcmB [Alphaproteobacteria bacterium]